MAVTLGEILKKKAEYIVDSLKKNLEKHDSIASRKLFQSIRFDIKIFGSSYIFQIMMEDYWKWVDEGRPPGKMPPIDKLSKWIAQKGLPIRSQVKGLKRKSKKSLSEQVKSRNRQVAFLIARSIGKKGIKPTNFYSDVINAKFWTDFKSDIAKVLKQEYTIQIIESIKEKK